MDGSLPLPTGSSSLGFSQELALQRTIRSSIGCSGVGLHSGRQVKVTLRPAPAGSGIAFRRTDLDVAISAQYGNVVDTRLCTVLGLPGTDARIGTVEHLMAAIAACGIGNLLVEVDGPELPVLDGSAEPWLFLLGCAGPMALDAAAPQIEVLRRVRVQDGSAYAELRPSAAGCLDLKLSIDFEAAAIGRQSLSLSLRGDAFREIARARTFTQAHEIAGLQAAGLAQGGSLDNAVVVEGARVLNPSGLRMRDEFVRHKMLDAVGDLAMAGAPLHASFIGHRSGHALNNLVLRALFADTANWRLVDTSGLRFSGLLHQGSRRDIAAAA